VNRIDRLLALILFLQSRRFTTASDLARHFGLSVRTIYRDVKALGEAGVPILAEAGIGYSLMKGYLLPPVNFSEEEAGALATAGLLLERAAAPSLARSMDSALNKVRAVLPPARREELARLTRAMGLTAVARLPEAASRADLGLAQKAIAQARVLRFAYRSLGREAAEPREVEPRGLLHYLDRWHLIAWCRLRRDFRDFRLDRASALALTAERFDPGDGFDPAAYVREHMPAPGLRAVVRFREECADRARREWWMGVTAEASAPARGGVDLTLAALDWDHLAAWLLSFGPGATVLSPPELRARAASLAREAARHHGEPPE
jgi:predicted DNA-binding transcriptional regulator YafY